MKTSKFFFSTLIAAAAMTATAHSAEYAVQGSVNANTTVAEGVKLSDLTSSDTVVFNGASGFLVGWDNGSLDTNIVLTDNGETPAFTWGDGSSNTEYTITFNGNVSGSGTFKKQTKDSNKKQSYVFAGALSEFSGNFVNTEPNITSRLSFGNGASAVASENISGTGNINWAGQPVVYNYSQGDLTIGNASIVAGALTFQGGANYVVNSDVTASGALSVAAGTVTFGRNASLALVGMTASSVARLDETQTGIQSGGVVYAIATGSGTISGLTTNNVTVNGSAVTSIAGDCRSVVGEVAVYNVGVNETVSYSNISSDDLAQASLINVAGTLDMGTSSSGGVVNVFSGGGKVVWTNTNASHGTTINLGNSFTGTLQISGNITSGANLSLGGAEKLILDGVWFWGGNPLTVATAVELTDKKSITDRVADTHYYVDGGGIAYTNTFDASGKIVTIAGGINSFSGTTTIGTLPGLVEGKKS